MLLFVMQLFRLHTIELIRLVRSIKEYYTLDYTRDHIRPTVYWKVKV